MTWCYKGKKFLKITHKARSIKNINCTSSKLKILALRKTLLIKNEKNKGQTGENVCKLHIQQRICIQNRLKTKIKQNKKTLKTKPAKEPTQLKNGQKTDCSLKRMYKWLQISFK